MEDSGEEEEESKGRAEDQMVEAEKGRLLEGFRERLRQALSGCKELPNDWVTTATAIRETGREAFVKLSEQRPNDKETLVVEQGGTEEHSEGEIGEKKMR